MCQRNCKRKLKSGRKKRRNILRKMKRIKREVRKRKINNYRARHRGKSQKRSLPPYNNVPFPSACSVHFNCHDLSSACGVHIFHHGYNTLATVISMLFLPTKMLTTQNDNFLKN